MHPQGEARECLAESFKTGEPEQLDREIARAQVYAILALGEAIESFANEIREAARDIAIEMRDD